MSSILSSGLGTDPSNVSKNILPKLKGMGLVVMNGRMISLREL